jgi:hypothetical protein
LRLRLHHKGMLHALASCYVHGVIQAHEQRCVSQETRAPSAAESCLLKYQQHM